MEWNHSGELRGWVGVVPDRSLGLVVDLSY